MGLEKGVLDRIGRRVGVSDHEGQGAYHRCKLSAEEGLQPLGLDLAPPPHAPTTPHTPLHRATKGAELFLA